MIGLVDGDVLAFRCAAATEYTTYVHPTLGTFRNKRPLMDVLKYNYDDEEDEVVAPISTATVTEPIEHSYQAVKSMINSILLKTGCESLEIYIHKSGPTFRDKLPYPVKYKGERPPKPTNYKAIWEHIVAMPNTYVVTGIETDDALGMKQAENTVICSVDKDLLMIPGHHYDIAKQELSFVNTFEAMKNFYGQMLTGDRVDNVVGIYGLGPKTRDKLLAGVKKLEDFDPIIKEQYQKEFGETWEHMYETNKRLLWILRKPHNDYEYSITQGQGR